ncbi:MAG: glycosyltransferase family 2 protein [Alphaproteobacteria bacterium]|nr:glycosyltransferase family 2 protein [Alphaproteobacteria bacterium]
MIKSTIGKLRATLTGWVFMLRFMVLPWLAAWRAGRQLVHAGGPAMPAGARDLVVVAPCYGDHPTLLAFLDHHRELGVDLFVFLDLSPAGTLAKRLHAHGDCAVWRPRGEPDAKQALLWLNALRRRYATGRWCLSLEISDLFVFARSETRNIKDLIEFLETEQRDHIYALVVELYGNRPAEMLQLEAGEHPLALLPYFDVGGYTTAPRLGRFRNMTVRGGMQRRILHREAPRRAPPLNRLPLVKWRWYYGYVATTRMLMPRRLNWPHSPWHSSPTAALLRFALLENDGVLRRAAKAEAADVILPDGGARSFAQLSELRDRQLRHDSSRLYASTWDLVECGLVNPGQWF